MLQYLLLEDLPRLQYIDFSLNSISAGDCSYPNNGHHVADNLKDYKKLNKCLTLQSNTIFQSFTLFILIIFYTNVQIFPLSHPFLWTTARVWNSLHSILPFYLN